jgi:hypothetical protein
MLNSSASAANQTAQDREQRRQHLLQTLRGDADAILERMADALVDLPEGQLFGSIEYTLRDLGHHLATRAHQAGLDAGKKRATKGPAASVPTVRPTPASSATAPSPS